MGGRFLRDNRRWKWVVLATIWTLAILALCWLPMPFFSMGGVGERAERIPNIDKVIHAGIFAIFGLLWIKALPVKRRLVIVLLAGVVLAASTEIVQSLPLLNREGDPRDAAADIAGVIGACVFAYIFLRGRETSAALPEPMAGA